MRIAVLSDVHGNLTAFDAVLADIDARGIATILNLGDVAGHFTTLTRTVNDGPGR